MGYGIINAMSWLRASINICGFSFLLMKMKDDGGEHRTYTFDVYLSISPRHSYVIGRTEGDKH